MTLHPDPVTFVRKVYPQRIVFVDGLARCGKSLLAPIVGSLADTEPVQMRWILEHVPVLHAHHHITTNAAVTLLQTELDLLFYNNLLGRNINCRKNDLTSIHKSRDPESQIKRLSGENEGATVFDSITPQTYLFIFFTHDACATPELFFSAFPELRIILMKRHPVDLVHSWHRKRTAGLQHSSATMHIQAPGTPVPWGTFGWEQEYESAGPMDKVIRLIHAMRTIRAKALSELAREYQKQILQVDYDVILTHPEEIISKIEVFLGTHQTPHTSAILKQARCPRTLDPSVRQQKENEIRQSASPASIKILNAMIEAYTDETASIRNH